MKAICLVLLLVTLILSCKRNEVVFSCDPELNKYVTKHTNQLKSLSLADFTKSDLAFQQAVFRSYDAGKKREIWLQKIQLILDTQNYSESEYLHVASLLDHLHENYFTDENIASEAIERRQFAAAWILKARTDLGWTDKEIAFVVNRLYTNMDQFNTEISSSQAGLPNTGDPNSNCTCSTESNFCITNFCVSGSCNVTTGCGWLWSENCDGKCN